MQGSSRAKFFLAFLAMIGTALFLFVGWKMYMTYSNGAPDLIKQAVEQYEAQDYAKAMADTYGGKTPQETLQLYINAVEKGDYVLASKYFIGANQKSSLEHLETAKTVSSKQMKTYLDALKRVLSEGGRYSADKNYFSFNGDVLVNMKLYPNGIWKIIEI